MEVKTYLRIKNGIAIGDARGPKAMPEVTGDDEWRECDAETLQHFRSGMQVKPASDGAGFEVLPPPPEIRAMKVRLVRNARLAASDWTQAPDRPMSEELRARWADYRQKLRDLPQQPGFPDAINWPRSPDAPAPDDGEA